MQSILSCLYIDDGEHLKCFGIETCTVAVVDYLFIVIIISLRCTMITSRYQEFPFKCAMGHKQYQRFVALSGLFDIDWMSTNNCASRCYIATIIFVLPKCCSLKILSKIHWNHLICMCMRALLCTNIQIESLFRTSAMWRTQPNTSHAISIARYHFFTLTIFSRTNYIWKHT